MNKKTTILLVAGGVSFLTIGRAYYNAVNNLSISPVGVKWQGVDNAGNVNLLITIAVQNNSALPIPIPSITADLYTGTQHLASGQSTDWQMVSGNGTTNLNINAVVQPGDVGALIATLINTEQLPANLILYATLHLPLKDIPITVNIVQT